MDTLLAADKYLPRILAIAREGLAGEIDAKAGRWDSAVRRLDRAVRP